MSLFHDKRFGVYRMRETVRLPNGKTVRLIASGENKTAARAEFERKRAEAIDEIRNPKTPTVVKGTKSFEVFVAEWLKTYPAAAKNRETTKLEKGYHIRVRLLPYFRRLADERGGDPIQLREITPKVIDRLIADLSEATVLSPNRRRAAGVSEPKTLEPTDKKLSAQTVKNIVQTLRKVLTSAKRWDELEAVPEIASVKVDRVKIDFFTFDEVDRLFAAIESAREAEASDDLDLLMTAARLGLRAGEVLGLQWSDIDLVKGEARIEQQLAHNMIKRVPVKAGVRTIPIPARLRARLKARRHLRGPWVFCNPDGVPFSRFDFLRKLEKWCRRAGLRRLTPHKLRHTFASHLVMRGVHLKQVQEWCGHSSIQTTMRYAHLAPRVGASMIEVLEAPAPKTNEGEP